MFSIIAGAYIIYKITTLYSKKMFSEYEVLIWCFFGFSAVLFGIYPPVVDSLLGFLSFTSRANFIFSASILAIYVIVLKLYVRNKRLQEQLTEVVRKIGIEKYRKG